ncbi:hypothetical protein D6T63_07915 [Arthrobacter cheniae]|uniref:Uncharacterized protein n=2 Tax=Arthrobacter cheniae TaxID=1258888 RepID=A0A3A5M886_9MICC|nr:hypothetical protein D6T63_07915 [Arthrobacter cheniae]
MHDLPEVIDVLNRMPERVDRDSTRELVLAELEAGHTLAAFIGAMVWGYGTTGYGPVRTRWILTGIKTSPITTPVLPSVSDRLSAGVEYVRKNGAVEGFRFMNIDNRIKHLGAAYFTKWLYFSSSLTSADDAQAAPILDAQVAKWLLVEAALRLDTDETASYEKYVQVLNDWGHEYGRTAVQVEKIIFGLATGRG